MKVAPDLSYFVLVKPKKCLVVFGEDGLPRSYEKSDRVVVVDTKTGNERELAITDSRTEGKRCVTDVSPDSRRVVVGCMGGVIKVLMSPLATWSGSSATSVTKRKMWIST